MTGNFFLAGMVEHLTKNPKGPRFESKTYKDKVGYSLTSLSWLEPPMSPKLTHFQESKCFLHSTNGLAYVMPLSWFKPLMSVNI